MGAVGTEVAIEAAHIALMREDWNLVLDVLKIARRTANHENRKNESDIHYDI